MAIPPVHRSTSSPEDEGDESSSLLGRDAMNESRQALKREIWEKGWINHDIKPIEPERRTWTFWTFANLSVLANMNISAYMSGSALLAIGLNWWQSLLAITIGSLLATFFTIVNGTPGIDHQLGFPVANRYVWGIHGSLFVIVNRIILSIIWYGFQAWIGGECLYVCLYALFPNTELHTPDAAGVLHPGITKAKVGCYIIFNLLSLPLHWIPPHRLNTFFTLTSTLTTLFFLSLLSYSLTTIPLSFLPPSPPPSIPWTLIHGATSTIGAISAGILNNNDYTRFSSTPSAALYGQSLSSPITNILISTLGILVTATTNIWNLPDLLITLQYRSPTATTRFLIALSGTALTVSQLGLNVAGNALSGGADLAAVCPRYINIRRGAYVTALLSPLVNPWRLVETAEVFLEVMGVYSVVLGPMVGLMVAGYYGVHKRKIGVVNLYVRDSRSIYWYTKGIDWRAAVAWVCGVAPCTPWAVTQLYQLSFLAGFVVAAGVYLLLHRVLPDEKTRRWVEKGDFVEGEMMDEVGIEVIDSDSTTKRSNTVD